MKSIAIIFSFALVIISCQKETNSSSSNDGVPAETLTNVSYGTDPAQKMDIYLPAGRTIDTTKLIILVHGGAWLEGDKSDFSSYVTVLKQRLPGYAVANINYRLASAAGNFFPTQENDMKAAINFLVDKSNQYLISQKIVLLGASAGAHMALLQAYKYSTPKVSAVVDFFGPADMTSLYNSSSSNTKFALQLLLSGTPTSNSSMYQQSSPVNFVDAQDPPTIIFHGDMDMIVNVSQSTLLKDKLQAAGVTNELTINPGLGHDVWPPSTMNQTFDKIEAFIKANVQ
jgi:acetyl esterase/lipase